MSTAHIHAGAETPDLRSVFDRAIDVRIDARLDALTERLGEEIARRVADIVRSEGAVAGPERQLLLTVPAAATLLSLSRSTVYELMRRGDLPSVKVGGARRIQRDALEVFRRQSESLRQKGTPGPGRAPAA